MRQAWTVSEVETLRSLAGRVPVSTIARMLHRSAHSVELVASRNGISLRRYTSRLSPCPSCGRLSATIDRRRGVCRACILRAQLEAIHGRIALLMQLLPAEERATYQQSEVRTGSRRDPPPEPCKLPGKRASARAIAKAVERREMELEAWEIRNLHRRVRAAQKRKERIQKKVDSMSNPQEGS